MTPDEVLTVFCSCSGIEEAEKIARALVERRLAACVNIISGVQSLYRWQGNVETAVECLMLVKTSRSRFDAIRDSIRQLHSYEVPEILAIPVTNGSQAYIDWIAESVTS